jgi:hypothetical protein
MLYGKEEFKKHLENNIIPKINKNLNENLNDKNLNENLNETSQVISRRSIKDSNNTLLNSIMKNNEDSQSNSSHSLEKAVKFKIN